MENFNSDSTNITSSPGASNNDTPNASEPDDFCASNNHTPNASEPYYCCASNNNAPNASEPDDCCASNNDTLCASEIDDCSVSKNDTPNVSDSDKCFASKNDTSNASDPDECCASSDANDTHNAPESDVCCLLQNVTSNTLQSNECCASLNCTSNLILDCCVSKNEELLDLMRRLNNFLIMNSTDTFTEAKEKIKTYLQELQEKLDKGIVSKEWYFELNTIANDIDEMNEKYSNNISTIEQLNDEYLKKVKQHLTKLGYKDRKMGCREPILEKTGICRLMHKTPFCENCGWRNSWIKNFRKRGIYVKEAAHGTDKHIWYNNIKDK